MTFIDAIDLIRSDKDWYNQAYNTDLASDWDGWHYLNGYSMGWQEKSKPGGQAPFHRMGIEDAIADKEGI